MGKRKDPFPPPHSSYNKCLGGIPGSQLTRRRGKRRGLICCLAPSEPVSFLLFSSPFPSVHFCRFIPRKFLFRPKIPPDVLSPSLPLLSGGQEDPSVGGYEFLVRSLVMLHLHSPWNAFLLSLPPPTVFPILPPPKYPPPSHASPPPHGQSPNEVHLSEKFSPTPLSQ